MVEMVVMAKAAVTKARAVGWREWGWCGCGGGARLRFGGWGFEDLRGFMSGGGTGQYTKFKNKEL